MGSLARRGADDVTTPLMIEDLGSGVFFVEASDVNWLLVREGADVVAVDCGYPGYRAAFEHSVRAIGGRLENLVAVLLTHSHIDHMGSANHLYAQYGVPIYMDAAEVPLARRERTEQATAADVVRNVWRPGVLRWSARIAAAGALHDVPVGHAAPFPHTGALDLPGRPLPVPTHGHTSGHSAYLFADAGVVATGDALLSGHAVSPVKGPQVSPAFFNHADVRAGLNALVDLPADTVVPGHGPVLRMNVTDAVVQAYATVG